MANQKKRMDLVLKIRQKLDSHVLRCTDEDCNYIGRPIIKMGGLICRRCRVILKKPGSDEYTALLKEIRNKVV